MERGAGSEQESLESEMGDGDNDSGDCGVEMEVEAGNGPLEVAPVSSGAAGPSPAVDAGVYSAAEPFEGMEFDDEEEAWTFYNMYARRVGFSTRISVMHRSRRDGSIMSRQFVCAREGFRTYRGKNEGGSDDGRGRRTRAVTRVGCKAMIRVKKLENGRWTVTKLETVHNHSLVPPSQAHCLRPHKPLSECGKQRTFGGPKNGGLLLAIEPPPLPLPPPPSAPVHDTTIGAGAPHCTVNTVGKDIRAILDYVRRMQAEDPAFFYAVQFVEGHPVGNVFWADARARMAYKDFGDAIVLDDYCKRGKFEVPLAAFTGVNHHCQPVVFGCAVIVDNSESSLVWLFETLLLAMSGQRPVSLTTEHDSVIRSAIQKVLPQTKHRFCKWHVLEEARGKLSDTLNAHPSFHEELVHCVDMAETVDEFEANWRVLLSKFSTGDGEWLGSMYDCRQQWVPVYLRNTFFGDLLSSQQCASRSLFFECCIHAETDAASFIQQYEKALDSCYEKEVKEEFDTKYSLPDIKTSSPIEKQAAEVYTRTLFLKFQQELIDASLYNAEMLKDEGNAHTYKVMKSEGSEKAHTVEFNSSEASAQCSCHLFEYFGIICRHILTVFGAGGVSVLPSEYIVKRWTKNAIDKNSTKKVDVVSKVDEPKDEQKSGSQEDHQSLTWRYNSLCREAIRFAEEGASSIEIYIVAMQALREAANKVNMAKRGVGQVAPLAVMPIAAQPPANFEKVQLNSFSQEKKRKRRSSNDARQVSASWDKSNQLMYLQQPINFLFVAPGISSDSQGPNQLVAAAPLSLSTQYGQALSSNNSTDGKAACGFFAVEKTYGLPDQNGSVANNMQGVQTKSSGVASHIKEGLNCSESCQANDTKGRAANPSSSTSSPQLVTVPIGLCLPSMDGSMISGAGMNCSSALSNGPNGYASFGLQPQPAPHLSGAQAQPRRNVDNADSAVNPENLSTPASASTNPIRAAAIAAGARIASPSDAASIIKAAKSKGAIHIRPGESPPSYLKPLAPKPLSSLPPVDMPGSANTSSGHIQPGQSTFSDTAATKGAIFGSTDSSDEDDYDDDDSDGDDDEGLTGDEVELE